MIDARPGAAIGKSSSCAPLCPRARGANAPVGCRTNHVVHHRHRIDRAASPAFVRALPRRPRMTRVRGDDLLAIGLEQGPAFGVALNAMPKAVKRLGREAALAELRAVVAAPSAHTGNAYFARVAEKLIAARARRTWRSRARRARAVRGLVRRRRAGRAGTDAQRAAAAVGGAGRPDARCAPGLRAADRRRARDREHRHPVRRRRRHRLPDEAVVLDLPAGDARAASVSCSSARSCARRSSAPARRCAERADHDVMDEDWAVTQLTRSLRDKAAGSSGRAAPATTSWSSGA